MTTQSATYRIAMAPLGFAIVMRDTEGFESTIEVGIKSYASALKRCNGWTKREATAVAKAAKLETAK